MTEEKINTKRDALLGLIKFDLDASAPKFEDIHREFRKLVALEYEMKDPLTRKAILTIADAFPLSETAKIWQAMCMPSEIKSSYDKDNYFKGDDSIWGDRDKIAASTELQEEHLQNIRLRIQTLTPHEQFGIWQEIKECVSKLKSERHQMWKETSLCQEAFEAIPALMPPLSPEDFIEAISGTKQQPSALISPEAESPLKRSWWNAAWETIRPAFIAPPANNGKAPTETPSQP